MEKTTFQLSYFLGTLRCQWESFSLPKKFKYTDVLYMAELESGSADTKVLATRRTCLGVNNIMHLLNMNLWVIKFYNITPVDARLQARSQTMSRIVWPLCILSERLDLIICALGGCNRFRKIENKFQVKPIIVGGGGSFFSRGRVNGFQWLKQFEFKDFHFILVK